jgi:hypothetical protein
VARPEQVSLVWLAPGLALCTPWRLMAATEQEAYCWS